MPILKIYMTAGIEEVLSILSDEFAEYLEEKRLDYKYEKFHGGHNWDFWRERIEPAIEWCLEK